jgi:hypothetical protein
MDRNATALHAAAGESTATTAAAHSTAAAAAEPASSAAACAAAAASPASAAPSICCRDHRRTHQHRGGEWNHYPAPHLCLLGIWAHCRPWSLNTVSRNADGRHMHLIKKHACSSNIHLRIVHQAFIGA